MQVTELLNEGLTREIKVVVPASDMETRLTERLNDAKSKANINGFRPGKVPISYLRKTYGKSMMADIVNEILNDSTKSVLADRGEKAAMQPEIAMTEDEKEAELILECKSDFEFKITYQIIPAIEIQELSALSLTRPIVEIADEEVDEQLTRIAQSTRTFETKEGAAQDGDRVTMDFVGKLDGEPFEGGSAEGSDLVLGSNQFIPGFEEQLIGLSAGDEKTIKVTFPEDYQADNLAGKEAEFDVKVHAVATGGDIELNDETATKLGLESMDKLREVVRGQIESQYGQMTRQKVKRQLLDALDDAYKFEAPSKLVEAEFDNIWRQVNADLEQAGKSFEDEDTTEDKAREEYMKLAERRVRLGLVLSEIGSKAEIEVTEEEMQRALYDQVRNYQGNQEDVYRFYRENPDAVASLRAPIFEEKTVDHLLSEVTVTDEVVSKEDLMKDDEDEDDAAAAEKSAEA